MTSKSAVAAGFLAVALSTATQAEIIRMVYTGHVTSGTLDTLGLFGAPGGDLVGDAFTAVYTVNDTNGTYATDGSTASLLVSGGLPAAVTEVLTINGASFDVPSGVGLNGAYRLYGHVFPIPLFGINGPIYGLYNIVANNADNIYSSNGVVSPNQITTAYDFRQPMYYETKSADTSLGVFVDGSDFLNLYTATAQVIDIVPEPVAWALMLGGFGAIGSALRARRRAHPV